MFFWHFGIDKPECRCYSVSVLRDIIHFKNVIRIDRIGQKSL